MPNPISFIYDHWQSGTIGLTILAVVLVVGIVLCIIKECDK